jgi:hypothetical protein
MLAVSPWLYVILGVAVVGATGGAYVKGRSDGRALEFAERATLEEVAREAREAAIAGTAEVVAKITVKHTTIRQQAEVVTREIPIYRDCVNDPRVERLLGEARANGSIAESTGDRELPRTGASPAPNVR